MVTFVSSEYPRNSDALFNDKVALPAIKKIYMHHVNGPKEIWGSHLDAGSFNKLESLMVSNVKKDTKVFSLDTIKQMRNLKVLKLSGFQLAEELIERIGFYNDGVENSALLLPQLEKLTMDLFSLLKWIPWRELALQNLRYLKIWQAEDLTYLFSASVGRRLVNLEELDVGYCRMMEEIVGGESGDTNTVEVNVVFPHLKILRLCVLPALRSLSPNNVIIEFPSITKAAFVIEEAFVGSQKSILLDLLQKLHHVKELELKGCEIPLVLYDLEGRTSTILPRLAKLTLSEMHRLQVIPWKIFPIENLHYLQISQIDGLKFLFPASLDSKGFAQLEEIDIWSCEDIEQVLAQESTDDTSNDTASTTIVFPRVKIIKLSYLRSLRSFSSKNYKDLEFPSLVEVRIWQCPMMEVFSYGSLNTPRLREISTSRRDKIKHHDLNAAIKKRIEEETMSKDAETKFIEGETSQGMEEETMSKDAEIKFSEGETGGGEGCGNSRQKVMEGVASIALLPCGSISGHFIQLPHSICFGLLGSELECERECSRGEDYRLIKLTIIDYNRKKEQDVVVECKGHDAARFRNIDHAHGWEKDVANEVEQKHQKNKISISFECETLKADKEAEDHIRKFMPKLAGMDAVVNIGRMMIDGLNFEAEGSDDEPTIVSG
ncbi:hypothetical protein Nepgr_028856 [Nepenthes gracilis]|uniref:Disease resistance protein At4g27190-like leucine-rich repeats domain-containing protein n=1 Tax=Nepenthes gracilis TaxID=150966 RepID=A0AAD3Y2S4_NEPGR|nr:hypothetical protein Nepgr_028856 [Nepenthes gracilis]